MNIHVRFVLGMLSIAAIGYLAFNPIPQPFNTVILFALGANIGWQILKLWGVNK
jgi:hypothetical protein